MPLTTRTPDYYFKVGDLHMPLEAVLQDSEGRPVSITGATGVTFSMRPVGGPTNKIDSAPCTVLDDGGVGNRGRVRYTWQDGDTDTPGDYYGEFVLTWGTKEDTYPRGVKEFLLIRGQGGL